MIVAVFPLVGAFALDWFCGDPQAGHPVAFLGRLISRWEPRLRGVFPATPAGERAAGALLTLLACLAAGGAAGAILYAAHRLSFWVWLAAETLLGWLLVAHRGLREETTAVYRCLLAEDLPAARKAVARVVGRDTAGLDAAGVTRAAVETIAENTTDAVMAPLFYFALGGAALGWLHKAASTLDSMVGYRNERYRYFGTAGARLDDLLCFIPARLAALLMIAAAKWIGLDAAGAWRIWRRDRFCHASPNSAQTEAACAGALGVQLAGPSSYGGEIKGKPYIGDPQRAIEPQDILRANRLMSATSMAGVVLLCALRALVLAVLF